MPSSARHNRIHAEGQRFLGAGHGEERQSPSVEQEDGVAPPVDAGKPAEGQHARQKGNGQISPVADRCGRDRANQQIAGDTSEIPRHERQHQNAEQVEPALDGSGGTAEREDKGPD
jgi:hypothetical protein